MSLPISTADVPKAPIWTTVRQSPPLDLRQPFSNPSIKGKHIIITGGASGFGEGFARSWAALGASVIIADINVGRAEQIVADIRKATGKDNVWFIKCDVRNWEEQVDMFKEAVKLSPHGGIDCVVANAGIAGPDPMVLPEEDKSGGPKKPDLKIVDVNFYGALYTSYLALYWMARNPGSRDASTSSDPLQVRDRHLLLLGSMASICPIAGQLQYGAAKHGLMGLFRSMRSSAFVSGVRVNMLCPYFVETGIVPPPAKLLLAGGAMGNLESIVEGGTRLVADASVLGRALVVGPKVQIKQQEDGEWSLVDIGAFGRSKVRPPSDANDKANGKEDIYETALWEVYADDLEHSEIFTWRMVSLLNAVTTIRGWRGWAADVLEVLSRPFRRLLDR